MARASRVSRPTPADRAARPTSASGPPTGDVEWRQDRRKVAGLGVGDGEDVAEVGLDQRTASGAATRASPGSRVRTA